MASDEVVRDPNGTEVALGGVGSAILLDNEFVRVWELVLEPGESQTWHKHDHPYVIVAVEHGHNCMEFLDGSEPRHMNEPPGHVVVRAAGKPHMLTNEGTTRYVNRLIELKMLDASTEIPVDAR